MIIFITNPEDFYLQKLKFLQKFDSFQLAENNIFVPIMPKQIRRRVQGSIKHIKYIYQKYAS